MMDARPIGVFDSGAGGLTVLECLRSQLPFESTVYLGDVKRLPYGPRPQQEVRQFSHEIVSYLTVHYDIKLVVIACNTASAAALDSLHEEFPGLPVLGVITPGARAAVAVSDSGRIGVMATSGTVASGAYQRAIASIDPNVTVTQVACPELVPLAESGEIGGPRVERILTTYLHPLFEAGVDTLILGCTHYPLMREAIDNIAGGRLSIVDSAVTTAVDVARLLQDLNLQAVHDSKPFHKLETTGSALVMGDLSRRLFGTDVGPVEATDLAVSFNGASLNSIVAS